MSTPSLPQIPPSNHKEHFDKERLPFLRRSLQALIVVFLGLSIFRLFEGGVHFYTSLAALILVAGCLAMTHWQKNHFLSAIGITLLGSIIGQIDLFTAVGPQKFITALWILTVVLTTTRLLGSRVGLVTLAVNLTALFFTMSKEVKTAVAIAGSGEEDTALIVNLAAIASFTVFLVYQLLNNLRTAERETEKIREELEKQRRIVQHQHGEKDLVVREIYHRVQNNFQVIISLLRIQSRKADDPKTERHFTGAIQRVMSIAFMHEKMHASGGEEKIDFEGYIRDLFKKVIASRGKEITLNIHTEVRYIPPGTIVSYSLIFNELMQNSVEHAFPHKEQGEIRIDILRSSADQMIIAYADDGTWKTPRNEGAFGLELVGDLCEQMRGKLTRTTENGTTYRIVFDAVSKN